MTDYQSAQLKICFVTVDWKSTSTGGSRQYIHDLATRASDLGHIIHIFCINQDSNQKPYRLKTWQEEKITISEVTYCYQDASTFLDQQESPFLNNIIVNWATDLKPDIIHVNNCLYVGFMILKTLSKVAPTIHTLHDYYAITPRGQLLDNNLLGTTTISAKEWMRQAEVSWPTVTQKTLNDNPYSRQHLEGNNENCLMKNWQQYAEECLKSCSLVICPSKEAAEIFQANNFNLGITIIENGINKKDIEEGIKSEKEWEKCSRYKFLILGTIFPPKGQLIFCESLISAGLVDIVEVHLYGELPKTYHNEKTQQGKLKEICEKYSQTFFLRGAYDHSELPKIFSQFDVLVTPSLWEEVYGLTAREGLSYGLPLITTNSGGLKSLSNNSNVYLLKKEDIHSWSNALAKGLNGGELFKLINRRRQRKYCNNFRIKSADEYAEEILALYQNFASNKINSIKLSSQKVEPTPLRIAIFVHAHISESFGGTEHAAFALHNEINRKHPDHSFIATPKSGCNSSQPNEYRIETTANPFTLQAEHPDQRNAQLITLINDIQPNIIHFHHFIHFGLDALEFIKGKYPEIKIVLTLHEYLLLCSNQGQMVKHRLNTTCDQPGAKSCHQCFPGQSIDALHRRELASQRALLCCDAVISPSEYLINQFRQHRKLPSHQVVIENGLSRGIKASSTLQSRFSDDLNHFGFFGKVSELKGIIVLLQAIYKLKQKIDKPFFVHINGGGLEQQPVLIQTRVRNLLRACGDRVNLKGAYQQDQIPDLMRQCDWVVIPSIWWENSPVVIQEAFACERPVLGTDHGGIHEKIVDKGGIGFSCGDSSSLAACMQSALGNQELHTKLRREIQPLTTASICADQHLNLYNSLLSTHD